MHIPILPDIRGNPQAQPHVFLKQWPSGKAGAALKSLEESGDVIIERYGLTGAVGVWIVKWETRWVRN